MELRKRPGRMLSVLLCMAVLLPYSTVFAKTTSEKIDEQNQKIDELEEQQQVAEDAVNSIAQQVNGLNSTLSGLNTNLASLSNTIEELAGKISAKKQEIEEKQAEVAAKQDEVQEAIEELAYAEEVAAQQYVDMKKRIQYMYENGSNSLLMAMLSSDSISDFLSRAEYIESISSYDRQQLLRYQETAKDVAEKKATLENEQAMLEDEKNALDQAMSELTALEEATEEKKGQVSAAITNTQNTLTQSASDLEDAKAIADELAAQIEKEKAYEQQLEQQKAAEDAARIAAIKAAEAENNAAPVISDSLSDQELLAALIYCEAGGEIYDGQVAVGCVVMNRVRSSSFPNTVSGVIYQSGQFSPVASGRLATVLGNGLTTDSCRNAASTVLAGNLPYPDFLYFRSARVTLSFPVTWIGNQQFY